MIPVCFPSKMMFWNNSPLIYVGMIRTINLNVTSRSNSSSSSPVGIALPYKMLRALFSVSPFNGFAHFFPDFFRPLFSLAGDAHFLLRFFRMLESSFRFGKILFPFFGKFSSLQGFGYISASLNQAVISFFCKPFVPTFFNHFKI